MNFAIVVLGAPLHSQAGRSALRFIRAALDGGHHIARVFFLDDGVLAASDLVVTPQDETDWTGQWQSLARDHALELVVCISSALKRGILDQREAERYDKRAGNLAGGFAIGGLGQLVDAAISADRVITFGT